MKIINNIVHHFDDYECMWNGIEDIYMNKTGEKIPNQFFFTMSGFGGFVYLKTNKSELKRLVSFGDGRTKVMYKYLAPIVGFTYHHIESKTPEIALSKAKKEIDANFPVVIGALDMYYLDYYPKLYHKFHIPMHYVLMVGYNDEKKEIYIYDCGRKEMQILSYDNLFLAMNAFYPGLCNPNTICTIRMDNPNNMQFITKVALNDKANNFLFPQTNFLGYKGLIKFSKEIVTWEKELGQDDTIKIINNMVQFFGSVPTMPNRLLGINKKDDVTFMGSRDKISKLMNDLCDIYHIDEFKNASIEFLNSGKQFEILTNLFINYILEKNNDYIIEASKVLMKISELEIKAFTFVLDAVKKL